MRRATTSAAAAPRHAGGDAALRPPSTARPRGRPRAPCGADHDRHLALRRLREALGELGRRAAHDLLEALRQLAAHGDPPLRVARGEAASEAGRRRGDSNATAARATRELVPERAQLRLARAAGSRGSGTAPRRGRSRRAPSRRRSGPGSTVTSSPRSSAAATRRAPGSFTPGRPGVARRARSARPPRAGHQLGDARASLCRWKLTSRAAGSRGGRAGSASAACPRRGRRRPRASSRRTRSVTSSRLPIGVAQTTSGTPVSALRRAPRTRRARRRPGRRRRRAPPGRSRSRRVRRERRAPRRPLRAGSRSSSPPRAEASADDDDLRREDVRERADPDSRGSGRSSSSRSRASPSPSAAARPRAGIDDAPSAAAPQVAIRRRGRRAAAVGRSGGERLEVTAAVAVALAGRAVRVDDDVPELAAAPTPAVEAAVEDEPAADPGPEREHDHVLGPAPAPSRHSASAVALPSFSIPTGTPKPLARGARARSRLVERDVDRA